MPQSGNRYLRLWRHLVTDHARLRRLVDGAAMDAIEATVSEGERRHTAELRVAFEPSLSPAAVWRGRSPRERALEAFGLLRVWDTENNNGVLLYVLIADRVVEIVADRAAARAIPQQVWDEIARQMTEAFARGDFRGGTCAALERLNDLLAAAFPAEGQLNPPELADRPAVL